jgi:hypothetical protein
MMSPKVPAIQLEQEDDSGLPQVRKIEPCALRDGTLADDLSWVREGVRRSILVGCKGRTAKLTAW